MKLQKHKSHHVTEPQAYVTCSKLGVASFCFTSHHDTTVKYSVDVSRQTATCVDVWTEMKTTSSKRRPKSTVFKGAHYDPVSLDDSRTVSSYFPTIPPRHHHSSVRNFAFEKLPPLVELIPGGEALTRTRFGALFRFFRLSPFYITLPSRQTLKTEQERWTGGVHFRSNEFKKLQLRKKAVRLILHSFEELTVCTDETRFLAVEFLDQLLDKTEVLYKSSNLD